AWAGLDRRAIAFQRATIGRHTGKVYAKLSIADVKGEKTRHVLRKEEKSVIPRWLREFTPIQKGRATSAGLDRKHLVSVVEREDHSRMIRLFLALKAWVLDDGYDPKEARLATARRRLREKRSQLAASLRGKVVTVTGRLAYGPRSAVARWLKRLGASFASHATSKTDVLVVGAHYLGSDRVKIHFAQKHGVPMFTEAQFREKYVV
ncbi:MAG: BRCT domain-containing protein, partial [Vulcanimicrobiaceae bacterium]